METALGKAIEQLVREHPPESQLMTFFSRVQQLLQQDDTFQPSSELAAELDRLSQESFDLEDCRDADAILLVLQGVWPVELGQEMPVWKSLTRLIGALTQARMSESKRWWLLYQSVDIFYNSGPIPGTLDDSIVARLAEPFRLVLQKNGSGQERAEIAKQRSEAILRSLGEAA